MTPRPNAHHVPGHGAPVLSGRAVRRGVPLRRCNGKDPVVRSVFKLVARAGRTAIRCLSLTVVGASTLARDISERKRVAG